MPFGRAKRFKGTTKQLRSRSALVASHQRRYAVNRLILKSFQSPGDIVMLTAAVRELHAAYPGRYQTDVRTSGDAIWENNPHLTPLDEHDPEVVSLDMHYPLVHQSNRRPYHFLQGYTQYLEEQLNLRIPVTQFRGDIHLSDAEKQAPPPLAGLRSHARQSSGSPSRGVGESDGLGVRCSHARQSLGLPSWEEKETPPLAGGLPDKFWIIVAGGKYDFTAKWWNPNSFQAVVDQFQDRIHFVQCGDPKDRRDLCDNPVQISDELRIPKCMTMITPEDVIRRIEIYHTGGLHRYLAEGGEPDWTGARRGITAPCDRREATKGNDYASDD